MQIKGTTKKGDVLINCTIWGGGGVKKFWKKTRKSTKNGDGFMIFVKISDSKNSYVFIHHTVFSVVF